MFHTKTVMLLVLTTTVGTLSAAECVVNKAAYAAKVSWFKPGDIVATFDAKGRATFGLRVPEVKPSKEDGGVTVNEKSCGPDKHMAVVMVQGGRYATIAVGVGIGLAGGAAGAGLCIATGGTACVAAAVGAGTSAYGIGKELSTLLPEPAGIIHVGGLTTDVILRGTVFNASTIYTSEETFERKCTRSNEGYSCYDGNTPGKCVMVGAIPDCKKN